MRTFLVLLVIFLFLVLSLPVFLVIRLVGLFNRHAMASASQKIVSWIFKIILFVAGGKMTVIGAENIPADRAVLYTSNHRSYADIPMGYTTVPNLTGFIAKKEIKKVPGLSWWMSNMNCLFLDRNDIKQSLKTILKAVDIVNEGYSIFVMPEGTRNHSDELLTFKEGSFKIAEKTGCPVIPVAITNSDALYELHRPWVRKAKIVIHYGTPINVADMPREERKTLGSRVRHEIELMLEEDKKLIN